MDMFPQTGKSLKTDDMNNKPAKIEAFKRKGWIYLKSRRLIWQRKKMK